MPPQEVASMDHFTYDDNDEKNTIDKVTPCEDKTKAMGKAQSVMLSHTLPPHSSQSGQEHNSNLALHRFVGGAFITFLFICFFWGPFLPLMLLGLYLSGTCSIEYVTTATALLLVSMYTARHSTKFCRLFLRIGGYFTKGVTLHMEKNAIKGMMDSKGCLWCMHPHGTSLGFGFILNGAMRMRAHDEDRFLHPVAVEEMGSDKHRMRNADGVQAPILFKLPLVRSILMAAGCSTPATKKDMHQLFRSGTDFGILPGGMEEVALYKKGHDRVYIKNRMGFIKYALQYGYLVVPCYTFGESDLYNGINDQKNLAGRIFRKLQMFTLKKYGFVIPIFWGPYAKFGLPFLPRHDVPIHTVVGNFIQLPKIENPTNDDVKKYHQIYIQHITELFDNYKEQFGYGDRRLEIL